jgi:hypothetical protein
MGKQLVNFITCGYESSAPFFCHLQSRARTHPILVTVLCELLGTGRHDIAEILLKVALNTKVQIQIQIIYLDSVDYFV